MRSLLKRFSDWFDGRALREQWLISLMMVTVFGWFLFVLVVEPGIKGREQLSTELTTQEQSFATLQSQVNELVAQVSVDPNRELRLRAEQLERQEARLEQSLEARANFVKPEDLLSWIQSLLSQSDNLVLTHFDTKEPTSIFTTENTQAQVIQHPVEVSLEGDFFGIHAYLMSLSALPVDFYWQGLDYQVLQYPKARVTLQLYTLSYGETPVPAAVTRGR